MQAESRGAGPEELARLEQRFRKAARTYHLGYYLPQWFLPREFDSSILEMLMSRRLTTDVRRELPPPPGTAGQPVPVFIRQWPGGPIHIWVGIQPSERAEKLMPAPGGQIVVHGRGQNGRLWHHGTPVSTTDLMALLADDVPPPTYKDVLLLTHDTAQAARDLARGYDTDTPTFTDPVWENTLTGAVFSGHATVQANGTLHVTRTGTIARYGPRGKRHQILPRLFQPRQVPPVRQLTARQAQTTAGPWRANQPTPQPRLRGGSGRTTWLPPFWPGRLTPRPARPTPATTPAAAGTPAEAGLHSELRSRARRQQARLPNTEPPDGTQPAGTADRAADPAATTTSTEPEPSGGGNLPLRFVPLAPADPNTPSGAGPAPQATQATTAGSGTSQPAQPGEPRGPGERYLAGGAVVLPAGMTPRQAAAHLDVLAAEAEAARHPAGQQPLVGPQAGQVEAGLELLPRFVGDSVHFIVPLDALAGYQDGQVITAAGLTSGSSQRPGTVPARYGRLVIHPGFAVGEDATAARDADPLLGGGRVLFRRGRGSRSASPAPATTR